MNNRCYPACLCIILLILCSNAYTQVVNFNSWSQNYLSITSYSGNTGENAYTLSFAKTGAVNLPHWKVSVKLQQPVFSSNNKPLPANKISFQPTTTEGTTTPNPTPSLTQIGAPLNVILQENQEVFLVPQSNAPMVGLANGYYELIIRYNLTIAGGDYLQQFPTWSQLNLPLEFKLYDQNNAIIGVRTHTYTVQIGQLTGQPPSDPGLSIQIGGSAQSGRLDFVSRENYTNGVSVSYPNALIINANTDYQIQVKSIQNNFTSAAGNTLPLSIVKVQLSSSSNKVTGTTPIWLSAVSQKIAQGKKSKNDPIYFDISYATKPNDATVIEAKMEEYSTTLQYEIIPQ